MWFGVSATASGQTRNVSYTYDEGDRIKSIKHGGTTYAFDYDCFGKPDNGKGGWQDSWQLPVYASTIEHLKYAS